jgi:hypothetical protein
MTSFDILRKIIPPDQALANEALKRSLGQVKNIDQAETPALADALTKLEINKDLNLINNFITPLPSDVANLYSSTLGTGTGPNNTITTNDLLGTAAGVTYNQELPVVISVLQQLGNTGQLNSLTFDGGTATNVNNGVYTVMTYCLEGDYTIVDPLSPGNITIIIPPPLPGFGTYTSYDQAFTTGLIPAAANIIVNIANANPTAQSQCNSSYDAMGNQLVTNATNLAGADIDYQSIVTIGEVSVTDPGNLSAAISNANFIPNSDSTALGVASQLHEIGRAVEQGGPAQFFGLIANTATTAGQAVVASMREGRNIALLNAVGINLDTQIVDVNPDTQVANNLGSGQNTVAEARANIVI